MLLHAFKFSWLMWIFSFVHLVAIRWWFSLFIFIDYQTYFSMSPWKCCSICWRTFLHSTFLLAGFNYSKLTMELRLATSPVLIIWLGLHRSFSNLHPSVVLLLCVKWCVISKFKTIFRFLEKKECIIGYVSLFTFGISFIDYRSETGHGYWNEMLQLNIVKDKIRLERCKLHHFPFVRKWFVTILMEIYSH